MWGDKISIIMAGKRGVKRGVPVILLVLFTLSIVSADDNLVVIILYNELLGI